MQVQNSQCIDNKSGLIPIPRDSVWDYKSYLQITKRSTVI